MTAAGRPPRKFPGRAHLRPCPEQPGTPTTPDRLLARELEEGCRLREPCQNARPAPSVMDCSQSSGGGGVFFSALKRAIGPAPASLEVPVRCRKRRSLGAVLPACAVRAWQNAPRPAGSPDGACGKDVGECVPSRRFPAHACRSGAMHCSCAPGAGPCLPADSGAGRGRWPRGSRIGRAGAHAP